MIPVSKLYSIVSYPSGTARFFSRYGVALSCGYWDGIDAKKTTRKRNEQERNQYINTLCNALNEIDPWRGYLPYLTLPSFDFKMNEKKGTVLWKDYFFGTLKLQQLNLSFYPFQPEPLKSGFVDALKKVIARAEKCDREES